MVPVALLAAACGDAPGQAAPPPPPAGRAIFSPAQLRQSDAQPADFEVEVSGALSGVSHQHGTGACYAEAFGDAAFGVVESATFAVGNRLIGVYLTLTPAGATGHLTQPLETDTVGLEDKGIPYPGISVTYQSYSRKFSRWLKTIGWTAVPGTEVTLDGLGGRVSGDLAPAKTAGADAPGGPIHLSATWRCLPRAPGAAPAITVTAHGFLEGTYAALGVTANFCTGQDGLAAGQVQVRGRTYLFAVYPAGKRTSGTYPVAEATSSPPPSHASLAFYLHSGNEENFKLLGGTYAISPDHRSAVLDATFTESRFDNRPGGPLSIHADVSCGR